MLHRYSCTERRWDAYSVVWGYDKSQQRVCYAPCTWQPMMRMSPPWCKHTILPRALHRGCGTGFGHRTYWLSHGSRLTTSSSSTSAGWSGGDALLRGADMGL